LAADGTELWRGSEFWHPFSISVNSTDGSCWVADPRNDGIVHLAADGTELWRGGGLNRPLSASVNESDGTCWVADRRNNQVIHLDTDGTELWRGGGFNLPESAAADSSDGSCWVADTGNNEVVHLASDGTEIWRGASFSGPKSVSVDTSDGSCWVADTGNNEVVHLASDGTELWRGNSFSEPRGVSANATDGSCWVADTGNGDVVHLSMFYTLSLDGANGQVEVDGVARPLPWSGSFVVGTEVALEAVPDATYEFSSWSGDLSGSDNPTTITIDGDKSVSANFSKIQYLLSLARTGPGTILVNGVQKSLPWSDLYDAGSSVSLAAAPDSCYEFDSWSDDLTGSDNPTTITMDSAKLITANFNQLQYSLSLSGSGIGSIILDGTPQTLPWSDSFPCGTEVTLEAVPDSCHEFASWSGDLSGYHRLTAITIDAAKSVTANFTPIMYELSLSGSNGRVVVDGTPQTLPWSDSLMCGSVVSLEADPDTCYEFTGWSGDLSGGDSPTTIVMTASKDVTAGFEQLIYTLSLAGEGEGSVVVDGTPQTLPWSDSFPCGTEVSVEPVPESCHEFAGWSGDLFGSDSPAVITMDASKEVTASFDELVYALSVAANGEGSILVDGTPQALPWSDSFPCGTTVTIEAVSETCYDFEGWTGDLVSSENPAVVVADTDTNLTANFGQIEYGLNIFGSGGSVLVDGSPQSLPWSGTAICGSSVTLEALPEAHKEFAGWSGDLSGAENPVTIVMEEDLSVTASFEFMQHTLSVSASGSGAISVNGVETSLPWAGSFTDGASVTLAATPAEEWKFKGWTGDVAGTDNPLVVVIEGDLEISALFREIITFSDVEESDWAYDEIAACVEAGIVSGFPDGQYRPDLLVDRAAMAVYIARGVAGGPEGIPEGPEEPTFPDVPVDHWAFGPIEYVVSLSIVSGYGDGSYQPEHTLTRGQMSVFVARAIVDPTGAEGLASYTPPLVPTFSDVPTDYWCFAHVEYLAGEDVVSGYPDGAYRPTAWVTRAQMAVYMARAFDLPTVE
jgi:uncharacterized repeat protein (TIGR02543 family)